MPYANTVIYFMTGTGNSYRVSSWIARIARGKGSNTVIEPIEKAEPGAEITDGPDNLMGIVTPTHGFTAPWNTLKFVWRLPRGNGTHAFCVATRAGLKFGRLFIPGMSGSGTFLIALVLCLKGYSVRGVMSVDMPSNWFSLHPIQRLENLEAIISRAENTVTGFVERILAYRKVWITRNNLYEIICGMVLSPISVGYLFVGRFFLAKLFFANTNCNGCGTCVGVCPVGAVEMWGRIRPRPFWKYNCESCMRCATFCPQGAIEAGHSWGLVLYFITAVPVSAYLLAWLGESVPGIRYLKGPWLDLVVNLAYFYPATFGSYILFQGLLRVPVINRFFTHTTLTHYWGRYREPGTKLNQLAAGKYRAFDRDVTSQSGN
jgi:ferredoxin